MTMCVQPPISTDNDILELAQTSKDDPSGEDSDDDRDNEIDFPVPTTSEMRKCIISMHRYLDVHSKGEMNQTMDDIEQYVDNMMINKTVQKKRFFLQKTIKMYVFSKNSLDRYVKS